MKILEDAGEYLRLKEWAEKQIQTLGFKGAVELQKIVDRAIERGGFKEVEIEKMKDISFALALALNEYRLAPMRESIKQVEKYGQEQSARRNKRTTWNGQTQDELAERNGRIFTHFKKTKLTMASFARRHAPKYKEKYNISERTLRLILSKALGN